MLSMCHIY